MKILKKSLIFVLALAIMFVSAAGCGGNNDPGNNASSGIAETDTFLVQDGKSDYKIVIPETSRGYEAYAAEELAANFLAATNVEIPIVSENAVSVSKDSKLLILGETALTSAAGVTAPKNDYGANGFVIRQKDTNVYLLGGDTQGTLYAVYEFLHHEFGYEPYALEEVVIDKGVVDKKLLAFDMSEIPDIPHVQGFYGYFSDANILAGHRMRFNVFNEVFVNATAQPWHNTFGYVSPTEYNDPAKPETYHPKWFTPGGNQLHYTAHGDPEELQALQDLIFEKMVYFIERDFAQGKYYEQIGFMAEDYDNSWAQSDAPFNTEEDHVDSVGLLKEKYGDAFASAMLIQFINPLQERISQYMQENHDGRKMSITIFAYLETERAPVKTENGKQVPIDNSVVLHKDANILIAPIRASYIEDYDTTGMKATIDSWSVIASQFSFWFYDYYFGTNTFVHMDSTYSLQSYYQAAEKANATYVFIESPLTRETYFPFGDLKTYLSSKLGWDVNANVQQLIDNFFVNYYKNASATMQEYFNQVTTWFAYLKNYTDLSGVGGAAGGDNELYWNEGVLNGWLELIDKAYQDIEPLKNTDKALYEKLYERILYDSLMPRYFMLKHFSQEAFTEETLIQESADFKADCAKVGVTNAGPVIISDLIF